MLDVFHYLFEDDVLSAFSSEHVESKQRIRKMIYRDFYERDHKYGMSSGGDRMSQDIEDQELLADKEPPVPVDPNSRSNSPFPTKRYIPPTTVNANSPKPFGSALDAPLG